MSQADVIVARINSQEFEETCRELSDTLWTVVNKTMNSRTEDWTHEWATFYMPALRARVLGTLGVECKQASDGWNAALLHALREVE